MIVDEGPGTPDPVKRAELDQVIGELVRSAQQLGLTIKHPRNDTSKAPVYFGSPVPKDIELVTALLGPEYGAFAFRLFSAGVHAQPHLSSILRTQMVGAGREGMIIAQRGLTAQSLTGIATATAAGYVIACERTMAYFGVESSTSRRDSARAALAKLSGSDRSDHNRPID